MTIVNSHSATHFGRLITASGDEIDIGLELIGGRTLRMTANGDELGAWPIEECRVGAGTDDDGAHVLNVDGDDARFMPEDVEGFRSLVATITGEQPADEVADDEAGDESFPADADDVGAFLFGSSGGAVEAEVSTDVEADDSEVAVDSEDADAADPSVGEASVWDRSDREDTPPDDEAVEDVDAMEVDGAALDDDVPDPDAALAEGLAEDPADPIPVMSDDDLDAALADSGSDEGVREVSIEVDRDPVESEDDAGEPADVDVVEGPVDAAAAQGAVAEGAVAEDAVTEDDAVVGPVDDPVEDADQEEEFRGRFGGSSLERLSSAIGALKESRREGDEGDEVDDDELEPNTVADDVLASQRLLRGASKVAVLTPDRVRLGAIAFGVVVAVAGLALLAPRVWDLLTGFQGDAPTPSTIVLEPEPTVTTTTVPLTTTTEGSSTTAAPILSGTIFDVPAPEFVDRWNAVGGSIDPVLAFDAFVPTGPFQEEFTAYLRMGGVVEDDGTLSEFQLVIDPSGPTEYDRLGIQALGVAIATVDPTRSPEGRATLLASLGLNVRQPQLGGIDGTVESNGVLYRLVFDPETTFLTLSVAPAP